MPSLGESSLAAVVLVIVIAVVSLGCAAYLRRRVLSEPEGSPQMRQAAKELEDRTTVRQRRVLWVLVGIAAVGSVLLLLLPAGAGVRVGRSLFFLVGVAFSGAVGLLAARLTAGSDARVVAIASHRGGREAGARIAVWTGGVVAMAVAGLVLVGAGVAVLSYRGNAPAVLVGFGLGAVLVAMVVRVGGGILTGATDIGARMVGELRGRTLDTSAGHAVDLFQSLAVVLVAALMLGKVAFGEWGVILPLIVTATGAVGTGVGVALTDVREREDGLAGLSRGFLRAALVIAVISMIAAFAYLPGTFAELVGASDDVVSHLGDPRVVATFTVLIGVVLAGVVVWVAGFFAGAGGRPILRPVRGRGPGSMVGLLARIGTGLISAVCAAGVIAAAIWAVVLLSCGSVTLALFLVALTGCGLLTMAGMTVTMGVFDGVGRNAKVIGEMSAEAGEPGHEVMVDLSAVGGGARVIAKALPVAAVVLAAAALFGSYADAVRQAIVGMGGGVDSSGTALGVLSRYASSPMTLLGVILGAVTVFMFCALTMDAVTRVAGVVASHSRSRHRGAPASGRGVTRRAVASDDCTQASLRELAPPGLLAVGAPIAVGTALGVGPLAGFLVGAIAAGVLMGVFVAATSSDPFKDAAALGINPLIMMMNLLALLVVPGVVQVSIGPGASLVGRAAITMGVIAVGGGAVYWIRREQDGGAGRSAMERCRVVLVGLRDRVARVMRRGGTST